MLRSFPFVLTLLIALAGAAFAWNPDITEQQCRTAISEGLGLRSPVAFEEYVDQHYTQGPDSGGTALEFHTQRLVCVMEGHMFARRNIIPDPQQIADAFARTKRRVPDYTLRVRALARGSHEEATYASFALEWQDFRRVLPSLTQLEDTYRENWSNGGIFAPVAPYTGEHIIAFDLSSSEDRQRLRGTPISFLLRHGDHTHELRLNFGTFQ